MSIAQKMKEVLQQLIAQYPNGFDPQIERNRVDTIGEEPLFDTLFFLWDYYGYIKATRGRLWVYTQDGIDLAYDVITLNLELDESQLHFEPKPIHPIQPHLTLVPPAECDDDVEEITLFAFPSLRMVA